MFQLQKPKRVSIRGLVVSKNSPEAIAIGAKVGRKEQGAGVRDRRKEHKTVGWSEKQSEGSGWQGGGEAEGGQEKDWEVVCITRELSQGLRETSRPQGPSSLLAWEPSAWLGLTC